MKSEYDQQVSGGGREAKTEKQREKFKWEKSRESLKSLA